MSYSPTASTRAPIAAGVGGGWSVSLTCVTATRPWATEPLSASMTADHPPRILEGLGPYLGLKSTGTSDLAPLALPARQNVGSASADAAECRVRLQGSAAAHEGHERRFDGPAEDVQASGLTRTPRRRLFGERDLHPALGPSPQTRPRPFDICCGRPRTPKKSWSSAAWGASRTPGSPHRSLLGQLGLATAPEHTRTPRRRRVH